MAVAAHPLFSSEQVVPIAGDGCYSPNSSTPSGVLPIRPVLYESHLFTELGGIQCPFWLDGDVKHHLGGLQYTVLCDRSAYASCYKLCVTGDMAMLGWCPPGVFVGIVHLRVPESHTSRPESEYRGCRTLI